MTQDTDIQRFLELSGTFMNIEALEPDWKDRFPQVIGNIPDSSIRESFRRGFAKGLTGQIKPGRYEYETGWDFDTDAEFHEHLLQLWRIFYADADPRDSLT